MNILSSEKVRRGISCDRRAVRPMVLFFCSLFLISFSNAAAAQECGENNHDYYVDVTNDTGYAIYYCM